MTLGAVYFRSLLLTLSLFRRRKGHGQTHTGRRPLGTHRTAATAAQTSAVAASRAQAARQSRSSDGHPVHSPDWSTLGPSTARNGLRQRHELLASPSRLAGSRRVGRAARSTACAVTCCRPDRLVPGHRRLLFNPCCRRWSKTGPNPTDRARPGSKHVDMPARHSTSRISGNRSFRARERGS